MKHMRHRVALFTEITEGEQEVKQKSQDGSVRRDEVAAVETRLEAKRAELADYRRDNAEVTVAEEIALMEVANEIERNRDGYRSQLEDVEQQRDELIEQVAQRDAWVKQHGTAEQQWNYAREFEQGHGQRDSR